MTIVQVYVSGASPVVLIEAGSAAAPELPALLSQLMVDLVAPATSDATVIERSVSGVSLKFAAAGVPTPLQVADAVGVIDWSALPE